VRRCGALPHAPQETFLEKRFLDFPKLLGNLLAEFGTFLFRICKAEVHVGSLPHKMAKNVVFTYVKFLKIVKKLFSKSFLTGGWGSAPTV
jgi:hypothetical protein